VPPPGLRVRALLVGTLLAVVLPALLLPVAAIATPPPAVEGQQPESLQQLVEWTVRDEPAVFGVIVDHLETGEAAAVNGEHGFETASLYKLAVLSELYRQLRQEEVQWDTSLAVTQRHLALELISDWAYPGAQMTVREASTLMITRSDNTAGILLWTRLGQARINQGLAALGLDATRLDWESYTTPADMARWLRLAYEGELVDPGASAEMLDLLARQEINDRLPYLLPPGTRVAHKTGELPGLTHDVGIVYAPSGPFVLAVLTEWHGGHLPHAAIARLSRLVYDYFEMRYGRRE
jgi:beta-lactamase class A